MMITLLEKYESQRKLLHPY